MGTYGPAYDAKLDGARVARQHERIRDYMLNAPVWGKTWRTLSELSSALGYPESSISAQLRHLRKPKFGSYVVEKRRRGQSGLWEYRVTAPKPGEPTQEEFGI